MRNMQVSNSDAHATLLLKRARTYPSTHASTRTHEETFSVRSGASTTDRSVFILHPHLRYPHTTHTHACSYRPPPPPHAPTSTSPPRHTHTPTALPPQHTHYTLTPTSIVLYTFLLLITFPSRCSYVCYTVLVQRFEPQGRRFTNFHYYSLSFSPLLFFIR